MKRLYLDMNIYNRPFDDQTQVRIRLETIAIYAILKMVKDGKYSLMWSFMLEFENSMNPDDDIRMEIEMSSSLASERVTMSEDILSSAKEFESEKIKPRDAMHLASAIKGRADYFITCDDKLIKKTKLMQGKIDILSPIDFIRLEVR